MDLLVFTVKYGRLMLAPLQWVHTTFILTPLHELYFHGPLLHGWGFWGGNAPETVCASMLPGSHASFWLQHLHDCDALLQQRFHAFSVGVHFVVYTLILFKLLQGILFHCLVIQPALSRIECLLNRKNVFPTTWNPMPPTHAVTMGDNNTHATSEPPMFSSNKHTPPNNKY
jgi:hypothetical protein